MANTIPFCLLLVASLLVTGCEVEMDSAPVEDAAEQTLPRASTRPDLEGEALEAKPPVRRDSTRAIQTPQARTAPSRRQAVLEALADVVRQASEPGARGLSQAAQSVVAAASVSGALEADSVQVDSLARVAVTAGRAGDRPALALAAAQAYQALATSDQGRLRGAALVALAQASAPIPNWPAVQTAAAGLDQALTEAHGGSRSLTAGVLGALQAAVRGALEGAEAQDPLAVRLAAEVVLAALPTSASDLSR